MGIRHKYEKKATALVKEYGAVWNEEGQATVIGIVAYALEEVAKEAVELVNPDADLEAAAEGLVDRYFASLGDSEATNQVDMVQYALERYLAAHGITDSIATKEVDRLGAYLIEKRLAEIKEGSSAVDNAIRLLDLHQEKSNLVKGWEVLGAPAEIRKIHADPTPIRSLHFQDDTFYQVGDLDTGITRIEAYMDNTAPGPCTWFAVWRGDQMWLRVNGNMVEQVNYGKSEV